MLDSRYIIGVDLGTTTTSLYYVDTQKPKFRIEQLRIPQLVELGEVAELPLLPSFCYIPNDNEFPESALHLPWSSNPQNFVGAFARRHGATNPFRLISSAKSWLAHAGIDRTKPILPWGGQLGTNSKSPIQVSALYLSHLRKTWNYKFGKARDISGSPCLFEEQQIVITIPASFDEIARELTLKSAEIAGLKNVTLLEEPLAAFYAWLYKHEDLWADKIKAEDRILVLDIGGGTTDFSIIEMSSEKAFNRFAVGQHLLLGGDNVDIAMARQIEKNWKVALDKSDWPKLCELCRDAKEALLSEDRDKIDITLIKRGSSIFNNLQQAQFSKKELLELLETGFYPKIGLDSQMASGRIGIRQMGLPYAENPAITEHLLEFLKYAGRIKETERLSKKRPDPKSESRQHSYSDTSKLDSHEVKSEAPKSFPEHHSSPKLRDKAFLCYPNKILFNGGSVKSKWIRNRILSIVSSWFPDQPPSTELEGENLSFAVAIGAAYYGRVRRGFGVKVRGGISRSYYLELNDQDQAEKLVCILPRDTDENVKVILPHTFLLRTNEKVLFNLYSSSTRLLDQPGDIVKSVEELSLVAPLVTVLLFGKSIKKSIAVKISSEETEIGVLKIQLLAETTTHNWPLHFDLRLLKETQDFATEKEEKADIIVDRDRMDWVQNWVKNSFMEEKNKLRTLSRDLESNLGLRKGQWSLTILRGLAELLIGLNDQRKQSAEHEMRWLNLLGYCLRPGFGAPGDALLLKRVWKLWFAHVFFPKDLQVNSEWWIFWRRICAGLKSGHQTSIANTLIKQLFPKGLYRAKLREGEQAKREMWRCLGSLEAIPVSVKVSTSRILVERLPKLDNYELWTLARLGARRLFHAPENFIVPPEFVNQWVKQLTSLQPAPQTKTMYFFALAQMVSLTGVRDYDLDPNLQRLAAEYLRSNGGSPELLNSIAKKSELSIGEMENFLSDTLPIGISMMEEGGETK